MNPQFLPPPEIAAAPPPLWTLGAALVLTALVVGTLLRATPHSTALTADAFALATR